RRWIRALLGIILLSIAFGVKPTVYAQSATFQLSSPTLTDGGGFSDTQIANTFGCKGGNTSPEFDWKGVPDGTKSFALTVYDPDAPTGSGFWHWIIFNIPATATSLPAGAGDSTRKVAPEGSIQSRNDGGIMGYVGPCPPQGDKPHRYLITLY